MSKRPKNHRRVPDLGLICQYDFQDRNILEHWRRDSRDEQEDRRHEEEYHPNPVVFCQPVAEDWQEGTNQWKGKVRAIVTVC